MVEPCAEPNIEVLRMVLVSENHLFAPKMLVHCVSSILTFAGETLMFAASNPSRSLPILDGRTILEPPLLIQKKHNTCLHKGITNVAGHFTDFP